MAVFFFVVGLEVRRELSVGELTDRHRVVVPAIAAAGGLIVPALLYLAVNPSGEAANGWGVVIGTDTAFLLGALALVGPAFPTQLRVFLLTLTIADDVVAVSVIGLVYSESIDLWAVVVAVVCLVALASFRRLGVWRSSAYVVVGVIMWVATVRSGLHPTIAGMAAGLAIAATLPGRSEVEHAASLFRAFRQSPLPSVGLSAKRGLQRAVSVNERFQVMLHPWTSYVDRAVVRTGQRGRRSARWGARRRAALAGDLGRRARPRRREAGRHRRRGPRRGQARRRIAAAGRGGGTGARRGGALGHRLHGVVAHRRPGLHHPGAPRQATVGVLMAAGLSVLTGWVIFRLAAALRGERTASLPMALDRPVEVGRDHIRGPADAPLTLVEYGDFECPFCGRATGVMRELRERFGDELRYVFRHLPLTDVHAHAELAARAAEAAAAQGRFWEMHDLLFRHQDALEFEDLVGYAGELRLDVEAFVRDLEEERHAERIREDVMSAEASGARGTPTFFVDEARHVGPYDAETLARELDASRVTA